MPPALFLVLGLKKKNHWAFLFGAGLFLALGCAILGITLEGIVTGEVLALSRSTLMVKQVSHPVFFWDGHVCQFANLPVLTSCFKNGLQSL